jgi:hypothetical protein
MRSRVHFVSDTPPSCRLDGIRRRCPLPAVADSGLHRAHLRFARLCRLGLNLAEPRRLFVTPADSSLWPGNRSAPIYRTGQSSSMESGGATPPRAIRWTNATARHVGFPAGARKSAPGGGIPTPGFIDGTLHMQLHASAQAATRDIGERVVTAVLAHEAPARPRSTPPVS